MKKMLSFKRPLIATLLVLLALTTTVYAEDISCQPTMDDCPVRPDSCGCSSASPLTFASYSASIATAFGGRAPYQFSALPGFTISSIDSQTVKVVGGPACSTNTTLTVTDACNNSVTANVGVGTTGELIISGPSNLVLGAQYTVSGGTGYYNWGVSAGIIDIYSGKVISTTSACSTVATIGQVTVTDYCGKNAFKHVTIPAGTTWTTRSPVECVASTECAAHGAYCDTYNCYDGVEISGSIKRIWRKTPGWISPFWCNTYCTLTTADLTCQ